MMQILREILPKSGSGKNAHIVQTEVHADPFSDPPVPAALESRRLRNVVFF
jgi:hypothetical protein